MMWRWGTCWGGGPVALSTEPNGMASMLLSRYVMISVDSVCFASRPIVLCQGTDCSVSIDSDCSVCRQIVMCQ